MIAVTLTLILIVLLLIILGIAIYRLRVMTRSGEVKLGFGMTWLAGDTHYHFDRLYHPTGTLAKKLTAQDDIVIENEYLSIPKLGAIFDVPNNVHWEFYPHSVPVSDLYIRLDKERLILERYDEGTGIMTPVNWNDIKMLFKIVITHW